MHNAILYYAVPMILWRVLLNVCLYSFVFVAEKVHRRLLKEHLQTFPCTICVYKMEHFKVGLLKCDNSTNIQAMSKIRKDLSVEKGHSSSLARNVLWLVYIVSKKFRTILYRSLRWNFFLSLHVLVSQVYLFVH